MKLILVRHGETDWNRTGRCQGISDIDLNNNGKKQIQELADSLKAENIRAVYSSDLKRAVETARAIASHHNLSVNIEKDLREMDQGELEGLLFTEIRERYDHVLREWRESPETLKLPKGESLTELQERALRAFNKILARHSGQTVVTVSHNLTITTLLCEFTGVGLKGFRDFKLKAACKNHLVCNEDSVQIEILNDVSHLSPIDSLPDF